MGAATAETIIEWQMHVGPLLAHVAGHDIIDCIACGFRHAAPLPEPAALEDVYRESYYVEDKPTFLAHAAEDQGWAELAQTDRLECFEGLLERNRRRLLDVGSGPGFFLKTAQARGWKVLGVEPSLQAAEHARQLGVEVAQGFFNAQTAREFGRFDVVHMNNVLEHVPNPLTLVALAREILTPGGLICVNVPNDFSALQLAAHASAGLRQWWLAPPHHLNYFDFDSLERLLETQGFVVRERATSFPMELFLIMGENYVDDPALGRACHAKRKKFDQALDAAGLKTARRAFYKALAEAGMGREAMIIAQSP
ncbi:MAG TPA: class I SAM-dependent methyltransferase [Rhizomicrobium sp.]|jgi:2-polyprenyl-3-methyl-5-hydroxy-6-metoxy-1,4-benzoquinol methylase|nr:class I SAM-dependent methyltransferase [Rhizomicrobium sp.]